MISVYLVIALVCAILLIVMALMGGFEADADIGGHDIDVVGHDVTLGHYDAGHGDYSGSHLSPLSVPLILAFGTAFGAVSAVFEKMDPWYLAPGVGSLAGICVAGVMYFMVSKYLVSTQSSSHVTLDDFIGLAGMTTIAIRKNEPGQVVIVSEKRGRIPVSATAAEDIESNVSVTVKGIAGNSVIVEKRKEG